METFIYLIVNVLACIFSDSSKNTLSDAAKFVRGLRCPENDLLNSPPAGGRFRHHFLDALPTTKFLGEKNGIKFKILKPQFVIRSYPGSLPTE